MDRDSPPGVWEVLTGNRKTIFGFFSFLLALLLAFSAVYRRSATFSSKGVIESGETVGIEKREPENEGELNIFLGEGAPEGPVKMALMDENLETIRKVEHLGDNRSAQLEIGPNTSFFRLLSDGVRLNYEYRINYSYQPFRLLAIPAALFTVFGVIAIYRGFEQFMSDFAAERVQELEDQDEGEKEGEHVDFMGVDNEERGAE